MKSIEHDFNVFMAIQHKQLRDSTDDKIQIAQPISLITSSEIESDPILQRLLKRAGLKPFGEDDDSVDAD